MSWLTFAMTTDPPVDVVAVDGVDVLLHHLVTHGLGHPRGDVAQVMNNTGLGQRWDYISSMSPGITSYVLPHSSAACQAQSCSHQRCQNVHYQP